MNALYFKTEIVIKKGTLKEREWKKKLQITYKHSLYFHFVCYVGVIYDFCLDFDCRNTDKRQN